MTLLQTAVGIFGSVVSCLPSLSLLLANQLQLWRGLVCRPSPAGREMVTQTWGILFIVNLHVVCELIFCLKGLCRQH